jgi:hypothetical protein
MQSIHLRPEDFRQAWPHALARAAAEVGEVINEVDRARGDVQRVAQLLPQLMQVAEEGFQRGVEMQATRLEGLVQRIENTQGAFMTEVGNQLSEMRAEFARLQAARVGLDEQQKAILSARARLDQKRADFNSMPLWRRVFARV